MRWHGEGSRTGRVRGAAIRTAIRLGLLACLLWCCAGQAQAQKIVRVGVYDNMPLIGATPDGDVRGIYIDVLEEVARRQGWTLQYVLGVWPRLFEMLRNAEIDMLPVVAYTPSRLAFLDYEDTTLIVNWGVVYTASGAAIDSIMELRGARLGLQPEDTHARAMLELLERFQVDAEIVPYASYSDIFQALKRGSIDAGVVNRIFGSIHAKDYGVQASSIIFNPIEIRYAVPRGDPAGVLPGLNIELPGIKDNENSVFQRSLDRWLGVGEAGMPLWFWQSLGLAAALLALFVGLYLWQRRMVQVKTRDIRQQKAELEREVRQRELMHQALMQSEDRYRTLVEHAGEGLVVAQDGRLCFVNPRICDITGLSEERLLQMPLTEVVHPEDKALVEQNYAKRIAGHGDEEAYDIRIVRPDGEIRWLQLSAVCILWEGRPASLAFLSDITQRRHDEQRLRLLTAMVEQSTESLIRTDTEYRIRYMNRAAEELFGWTLEELEGKTPEILNAEQDATAIQKGIYAAVARGEEFERELKNRRKNGEVFDVRLKVSPIRDEDGAIIGHMASQTDISRRKEAERAILRNQEELRAAKLQAEEANRAKSKFLANMSHEIRTPLNGIMGMLQLLEAMELEKEQGEYVRLAILSSRRLITLVDDILDISRVEAGALTLSREPFDFSETFAAVEHLFGLSAQQQRIDLQFVVDPRIPSRLTGDAARLQQVLNNVVGNAIKFSHGGSVRVEASLLSVHEKACRLLIEVEDTGIGIPDDKIALLFNPFTQVESSYARRYQGAGLGLAIVKRLVTLMGGTIALSSEEDRGTVFCISLPFGVESATQPEAQAPHAAFQGALPRPARILLAEDDVVNRLVVAGMLRRLGHHVTEAHDGRQALDMLGSHDFELVIMDIQMPEVDGLEATRALRSDPEYTENARVPVLALTAYAMDGDKERFLQEGMDGYLAKPVELDELQRVITSLLQNALPRN